jgi:hypothetical protein
MYAARQWGGSSTIANGVWSDELGFYLKYPTEYRLAQSASKIIKSKNDWLEIFSETGNKGLNRLVVDDQDNLFGLSQEGDSLRFYSSNVAKAGGPVLSLDYANKDGILYVWQSNRDVCDKHLVDEIKLIKLNEKQYQFQSIRDAKYYILLPDGSLSKDAMKASPFSIKSR